jgi:protein-S-isoprenylcysteine O-methyltransferase Ste14
MWFLANHSPLIGIADSIRIVVAVVVAITGILIMLAAIISFRCAQTTVNPLKPETTTALVTSGVFRYTRNPMYLGMLIVLFGWAVFLSSPAALIGALVFAAYIQRLQIRPEERALTALFGKTFTDYRLKVRRWL